MEQYADVQQLLKKEDGQNRKPIYPPTVIQAVFDGKTGASLEAILAQFNSIYVQYQGTPEATRNIIPVVMRRPGLTITYMNMESETITERANSAVQKDNDHWGLDVNWSRVDELSLSGDISVSAKGTWITNGKDTGVKALGPKGDTGLTPWLKTIDNKLHFSYDNVTWEPCSDYIAGYFRVEGNKLQISRDKSTWENVSDFIAAWFRWNDNKIQISRDNNTWTDFSGKFADNIHIKGYVVNFASLPTDAVQGDIYGVGPTYAAEDTAHTNPIYRYYVRNANSWVDNGAFTSLSAGVVQETGDSETEVMSQKAVSEKLSELGTIVGTDNDVAIVRSFIKNIYLIPLTIEKFNYLKSLPKNTLKVKYLETKTSSLGPSNSAFALTILVDTDNYTTRCLVNPVDLSKKSIYLLPYTAQSVGQLSDGFNIYVEFNQSINFETASGLIAKDTVFINPISITQQSLFLEILQEKNRAETSEQTIFDTVINLRNAGYMFSGIATINTNPGTPSGNCFYIAREAGTYTYFKNSNDESIVLSVDGFYVLTYESAENHYWGWSLLFGIDNVPTHNSKNLIESEGVYNQYTYPFSETGFINSLNGAFTSSDDFNSTDYIPVFEGLRYNIYSFVNTTSVAIVAFYDDKKNFIDSISRYESQQEIIDGIIPQGVYYIRCSTNNWSGYANSVAIFANKGVADALKYSSLKCIKKETNADGYIEFTVPINQYIVDNSDYQDHLIDNETNIIDVNCYLKLPNSYTSYGKPSKLVMMCHGAGQSDISGFMNEPNYNNLVNEFTSHGYAVFDCSGYANTTNGCNFWGAPKAVSAWRKAYDYIVNNYNVERVISIYGFSMGGLTVMNLLNSEFPNVKCVALGSPVLDLYKCWNGGVKSQITTAYGINVWNQELYAGNNPINNIFTYNNLDYFRKKLPPLKIWYGGTEDGTVLPYVDKSDAILMVNAIRNSNGIAYYREITGGGHSICYGGNANVNKEIRMFFDRYSY